MAQDWSSNPLHRRATVVEHLAKEQGLHLVIVRYGQGPATPDMELWVHNRADIDRAKVVWAHDMGKARNQELIDYFHDRRVWFLNAADRNRMPVLKTSDDE
jgi:hypothetical protein